MLNGRTVDTRTTLVARVDTSHARPVLGDAPARVRARWSVELQCAVLDA